MSNKQPGLMGRHMAELGITPASRSRVASVVTPEQEAPTLIKVIFESPDRTVGDRDGNLVDDDGVVRIPAGGKQI